MAALLVAVLTLTLVTQSGPPLRSGNLPLPNLPVLTGNLWRLLDPGAVPNTPRQESGTAAGHGHRVPAASTRSGHAVGHAPGHGAGELPAYQPAKHKAGTPKTGPDTGDGSHSFNPKTSKPVAAQTTPTSTLYANTDGSYTRKVSSTPVNYRKPDGSWGTIDADLVVGADGRLHEKANSMAVSLAVNAAGPELASVSLDPSHGLRYALHGAAAVPASMDGATATYDGVLPDTNLVLTAGSAGLKESLVLSSASAGTSWVFPLDLAGLTARMEATGGVDLVDSDGTVRGRFASGHAEDSSVDRQSGNHAETDVTYALATVDGKPALRASLDRSWLADSRRVFPVTVDPTFNDTGDTYAQTGNGTTHDADYDLRIGTYDGGADIAASYLSFNGLGGSLAGQRVTSASLSLFDIWAANCSSPQPTYVAPITQSWNQATVTGYPGPSHGSAIGTLSQTAPSAACTNSSLNGTVGGWMTVGLGTDTFNSWTTGGANYGLAAYASTSDSNGWKKFDSNDADYNRPYLTLNYTPDVPPQVDDMFPGNNYAAHTLTPQLIAGAHDPDSWPSPLKYTFAVYSAKDGSVAATSGSISASSWTVPAGKLSWSQSYVWTVDVNDGYTPAGNNVANYFTTSVPQPLVTSTLAQNSGGHGFDPTVGNYTRSETDADLSTVGPALSVQRAYNSLDPRSSGVFGTGWSTTFDMKATETLDANGAVASVVVTYPDGQEVGFGRNADGTFTAPSGRFATLRALPNHGGYTLTDKNDTTYAFAQTVAGSTVFAISSVSDYYGQNRTDTFAYTDGLLSTVTSGVSGRSLTFTWNIPSGAQYPHVATVTTSPVTAGDSSSALTWTYSYQGDFLDSVCPPTSSTKCTTYTPASGTRYLSATLDTDPYSYWRLGETSGGTAMSSIGVNEGTDYGTYQNVTLAGAAGPAQGSTMQAPAFNGTSSYVHLPGTLVANHSAYPTVSLWFKTTGTGETLFSYQNASVGTKPSTAIPVLYVGADGKLLGGFWDGSSLPMTGPVVNDGQWHQAAVTADGKTQVLYLDGARVQAKTAGTPDFSGENTVSVGAGWLDSGNGWPDAPSASQGYFTGNIAEVAFYDHAVSAADVDQTYRAAQPAQLLSQVTLPSGKSAVTVSYGSQTGRTSQVSDKGAGTWQIGVPKVQGTSQVYRSAVLGGQPADYWRLADASGSQATNQVHGGYGAYNNVTLGATGPFNDTTAAGFDGSSSYVRLPDGLPEDQSTESVSLWFNTTSTNGVLYSAQAVPVAPGGTTTADYTPMLYVGSDGKLVGEFWRVSGGPMTGGPAINDGKWHHVVMSAAATNETLYLDGQSIATKASTTGSTGQLINYIGAGYLGGTWPDESHQSSTSTTAYATYFKGAVAEFAFYRNALAAAQVTAQYNAYKGSHGLAPSADVTVTDPGNHTLTYTYDPGNGNRMLSSVDALGGRTSYGYDISGFLHTVTDPNGNTVTTGHDVRGNTVSQTACQDQPGNKCATQYFTYYPDDTTTTLNPDPRNDLVLSVRDGRSGSATDNTYLTSYSYDAAGNLTGLTTPAVDGFPTGRSSTSTYTTGTEPAVGGGTTPAGLIAQAATPGGATETYSYFSTGDLAQTIDPTGLVTRYNYDGVGRATSKTVVSDSYPAGLTTSFGYDGQNRQTSETDPPVTDRVTGAIHTAVTTTGYDDDGNVTSQSVADPTGGDASRTTSRLYDQYDRVASVTEPANETTHYGYDAYGNKSSQTDPAGTETDYAYDPNGHLLTVTLIGYTGDPANPSSPASLVESARSYDPAGRLASITDSMGWVTSYAYTDDGLLATVTRSDPNPAKPQSFIQQSNTYDLAGNLAQQVANNGTLTTEYSVDAAGRTQCTDQDPETPSGDVGADRVTCYTYSPDDYVLSTRLSDSSGVLSSTDNAYDPLGRTLSERAHNDSAGHPVGWWPLTDGAADTTRYTTTSAVDAGGSGSTGQLSTGVTWATGAASFNGTSGVISADDTPLSTDAGQSFSVSAWVYLTSNAADQTAVAQTGSQASTFSLGYSKSANAWSFGRTSADVASPTTYQATSSSAASLNTWTHLVGVYNAGTNTAILYVNGAQTGSAPVPSSAAWGGSGPLLLGAGQSAGAKNRFLTGQLSNVQAYDRALSGTDAGALTTAGRTGTPLDTKPATTSWALDQRGLPTSMTDPDGNVTGYSYDEAGQRAVTTEPTVATEVGDGTAPVQTHPVTMVGYDTFGEQVETSDPNGNETIVAYDAAGRPLSKSMPDYTSPGSSTTITATESKTYTTLGQVETSTDALQHTTRYSYDQLGDLATATQPDNGVTRYTYDTDGHQLTSTDPTGAQTQATYDYLGHQLTATQIERYPSTAAYTTTNTYDPAGWLATTTSATGVVTTYGYNDLGERTSTIDAANHTTTYAYDGAGRQVGTTLPDGTSHTLGYDEAGNQVAQSDLDANGVVLRGTTGTFDPAGNQTSLTDARGHTTTLSYDATGMVSQEVQPVSATTAITTSFGYDAAGNRTRFTDGRGNSFYTTYNSWNLPESQIEPATTAHPNLSDRTFTTAYDAGGRVASQTSPGNVVVSDSYDQLGDLTGQTGSGAEATTTGRTFGYDSDGRMTSASAPNGTDSFGYDDRGLLTSTTGPSGSSSFGYNGDGQLATRTDAAGTSSYGYDNVGRLSTLSDATTGAQLTYGYNVDSQLASIAYGTGKATRTFGYNTLHQLTSDTLTAPTGQTEASIGYGYDLNGNETSKTTTGFGGTTGNTYGYDWANRLTSSNNGVATVTYGYDASGNRTQVGSATYTYDQRDELTSDGTVGYSYTARGTLSQAGSVHYTDDAYGQVASAAITGGSTQTYQYDALGRVVTAGSTTLKYTGTDNTLAADGNSTYSRDPSGSLIGVGLVGGSSSSATLALTDQHEDVVGEYTATGTALTGYGSYDPLGNPLAHQTMLGNLGYQSGWTDPATGRVNMDARWYTAGAGFTDRDSATLNPVPNSVAADRYAYADDNPLTVTDPTGHSAAADFADGGSNWKPPKTTPSNNNGSGWDPWSWVKHTVKRVYHAAKRVYHAAVKVVARVVRAATHYASVIVHRVADASNEVRNEVSNAWKKTSHAVSSGAADVWHAAKSAAKTVAKAEIAGAKAVAHYVEHHAAAIASFVVSTAVFAGCEAVTAGIGTIGCGAIAGAIGAAVSYGITAAQSGHFSWSALGKATLVGAVTGAVGGFLGALGGKAASWLLGKAASAVGGMLAKGAEEAAADGLSDAATEATSDAATTASEESSGTAAEAADNAHPTEGTHSAAKPTDEAPATKPTEQTKSESDSPSVTAQDEPVRLYRSPAAGNRASEARGLNAANHEGPHPTAYLSNKPAGAEQYAGVGHDPGFHQFAMKPGFQEEFGDLEFELKNKNGVKDLTEWRIPSNRFDEFNSYIDHSKTQWWDSYGGFSYPSGGK